VTVFHATWIPGLLLEDTNDTQKLAKPKEYEVFARVSQA
jgi:hypothetical protein